MFIGFIEWGGLYQFQEQDPDAPPVMGYTPANNNSLLSWRGAGVDQAWNTDQNVHIDKNVYKKKINIYYWYKKDKIWYKKDKNRYKKDKKDKNTCTKRTKRTKDTNRTKIGTKRT